MFDQQPTLTRTIFHLDRSHECCPVHTGAVSLPCRRNLLARLSGSKVGSNRHMVLQISPSLTSFPNNFPTSQWIVHLCILCEVFSVRCCQQKSAPLHWCQLTFIALCTYFPVHSKMLNTGSRGKIFLLTLGTLEQEQCPPPRFTRAKYQDDLFHCFISKVLPT